ncbi:MAG: hypothetical protein PHF60_03690 [Candidatus ainarchaeum sp.]|nr:hypothetical protein [Candidatus ainarchaeum sp.]
MGSNVTGVLGDFPETPGTMAGGAAFQIAIYVIVSMIVLVGIVYLLGKALSNRKLEEWAKNEFLQVFISAAMVGGLFLLMAPGTGLIIIAFNSLVPTDAFATALSGYSGGCSGVSPDTVICYAYAYMGYLAFQIMNLMAGIFTVNIILDILSKISIDVIVVEVTPLSGLSSIVQVFNSILQSLFFLGIMVEVERALLIFVDKVALQMFLPIGVVLRTFFGTRKLGGALMALAVGIYLVFPLTIAMNAMAVTEVTTQAYTDTAASLMNLTSITSSTNPMAETEGTSSGDTVSTDQWNGVLEKLQSSVSSLTNAAMAIPTLMTTMISLLVVQVVFLPILSIMLTVISIKELANLFGSEINLSRFEV